MTTLPGKIDFVRLRSYSQDGFVSYSFSKFVQGRALVAASYTLSEQIPSHSAGAQLSRLYATELA